MAAELSVQSLPSLLLLLLACHVALSWGQVYTGPMDPDDKAALEAMKASIKSGNFPAIRCYSNPYQGDPFYCNSKGRVVQIELGGYQFSGTISTMIGQLTRLVSLNLDSNQLSGAIPTTIGKLARLEKLFLYNNKLSGDIPTTIGQLVNLHNLDLGNNQLNGNIPTTIGLLTNLHSLFLDQNKLVGPIPTSITDLAHLEYLDFGSNQLNGSIPSTIDQMTNLQSLSLSANKLSGAIPPTIGNLASLESLDLSQNQLNREIPETIGQLTSLTSLFLQSNRLVSGIPSTIGLMTLLDTVDLSNNKLRLQIPTNISKLEYITYFNVSSNYLTGLFVYKNGHPTFLELERNCMFGPYLPFGMSPQSQRSPTQCGYCLSSPGVSCGGKGTCNYDYASNRFACTCNKGYETVYNKNTCIIPPPPPSPPPPPPRPPPPSPPPRPPPPSPPPRPPPPSPPPRPPPPSPPPRPPPPSPPPRPPPPSPPPRPPPPRPPPPPPLTPASERNALLQLQGSITRDPKRITSTWVGQNCCVWKGIKCNSISQVTKVVLGGNSISGMIPPGLGNLKNLLELDFSRNNFSGPIPSSIGDLQQLVKLDISGNQLSGGIPPSLGNCTRLQTMVLSGNKLSGDIPPELGNLTFLTDMYLNNNALSSIPDSFGNLKALQNMDLSSNRISGSVPSALGNLPTVSKVLLQNNTLSGSLSLEFSTLNDITLQLQANYLSGTPFITRNGKVYNNPSFVFLDTNCLNVSGSAASKQRTLSECGNFCNVTQPMGVCGGHGFCVDMSNPRCVCDPGYEISDESKFTCVFILKGLGFTAESSTGLEKRNEYFRYLSAGYIFLNERTPPTWMVATSWSWVNADAVYPIKDQGNCSICWAYAASSAIESAYFISKAGNELVRSIAERQFVDCPSTFESSCDSGGLPTDALHYAATNNLVFSENYTNSRHCRKATSSTSIFSFEEVYVRGWVGLLLALQQQPAIVNVEAGSSNFANYKSGVFADEDCFSDGVDHSLVAVGYDLTSSPPYWLLRNSWGTNWGEKGYMRIMITGGLGICGINSLPALIPIMKPSETDPCNMANFAGNKLKSELGPGRWNPCGSGVCIPNGTKNKCSCAEPFVAVENTDGSQTCAPASPCTFDYRNPCGVGTCIDLTNPVGTYVCICPPGYSNDTQSGPLTCALDDTVANQVKSLPIPSGVNVTCYDIYVIYGIPKDTFIAQNKAIKCSAPIKPGTEVNVTNSNNCSLVYAVNEGDTCASIADMFNMNVTSLVGPGSVNPDLDCYQLRSFQQVCIERKALPDLNPCTYWYDVKKGETCISIISNSVLDGNIRLFYALNPGVFCGSFLFGTSGIGDISQQVCLAADDFGSQKKGCKGKLVKLKKTDKCTSLKKCFNKKFTFKRMNNFPCTKKALRNIRGTSGKNLCVPNSSKCK